MQEDEIYGGRIIVFVKLAPYLYPCFTDECRRVVVYAKILFFGRMKIFPKTSFWHTLNDDSIFEPWVTMPVWSRMGGV